MKIKKEIMAGLHYCQEENECLEHRMYTSGGFSFFSLAYKPEHLTDIQLEILKTLTLSNSYYLIQEFQFSSDVQTREILEAKKKPFKDLSNWLPIS
jgi:hypothetical protein